MWKNGAALIALVLLAACGSDESSSSPPPIGSTPTPSPTPSSTPIPPRTQTINYLPGFSPGEDRGFGGYQLLVTNTRTGRTFANGDPEIDSVITLIEKSGPRSSDGPGFSGGFLYRTVGPEGSFFDRSNNAIAFEGKPASAVITASSLQWTEAKELFGSLSRVLTWRLADTFNNSTPEYYSVVELEDQRASDSVSTSRVHGGSVTVLADIPPSGQEDQPARLTLQSDEPGDGSYSLVGNGSLRIDYSTNTLTGTFALMPATNSRASATTVEISARLTRKETETEIRGDITSPTGSGRVAGSLFGPYAREFALMVKFETSAGQSFYGELVSRRP